MAKTKTTSFITLLPKQRRTSTIVHFLLLLLVLFVTNNEHCLVSAQSSSSCDNNPRQVWNETSGKCDCLDGLSGWDCQMCVNDEACSNIGFEDSNEDSDVNKSWHCHQSLKFYDNIPNKTYGPCTLDPALQPLMESGAFAITCNQPTESCEAALYIADHGLEGYHMIDCSLTGCTFTNGETNVDCSLMECTCGIHCSDLAKTTIEMQFNGKPVSVNVDTTTNHISMDVEGSFLPLGVTCPEVSSCYVIETPTNSTGPPDITVDDDDQISEEEDEAGFNEKFQDDWKGAPAVSIVMLFIIGFIAMIIIGCNMYYNFEIRLSRNNAKKKITKQHRSKNPTATTTGATTLLSSNSSSESAAVAANNNNSSGNNIVLSFDNISVCINPPRNKFNCLRGRRQHDIDIDDDDLDGSNTTTITTTYTILDNINGRVESGQVLALLGSSGAGKSTLLNVLAGILPQRQYSNCSFSQSGLHIEGHISINDCPRNSATNTNTSIGYVQHQASDALFATLTVRECIEYSALLRLPMKMALEEKQRLVNQIMEELQISHLRNHRIGFASSEGTNQYQQSSSTKDGRFVGGRISTGERRRVSIGMELITNPQLLFLDEPTTGLDSATANKICKLLHSRAKQYGTIVVMSIHQPSSNTFRECFDNVLVLTQRGGKTLYYGPPKEASNALIQAGFHPCEGDNNNNTADHLLDAAASLDLDSMKKLVDEGTLPIIVSSTSNTSSPSSSSKKKKKKSKMKKLKKKESKQEEDDKEQAKEEEYYTTSDDDDDDLEAQEEVEATATKGEIVSSKRGKDTPAQQQPKQGRSSLLFELQILLNRTINNIFRNQSLLFMHGLVCIILATVAGLIFEDVTNDLAGFQNRVGAFYFSLIFFAISSLSSVDVFLSEERVIFLREAGAKYYKTFTYFMIKSVLDSWTLRILPATLFAVIFYFLMGLQAVATKFLVWWVTLLLFNVAAGSIIIMISSYASSVGVVNLIATVIFLIQLLFGGLFLNLDSMSPGIVWLKYLSIFYYAFELLMTNEFEGLIMDFDAPGYPSIPVKGEVFLLTLGLDIEKQVQDLFALVAIAVGCNLIAYILLCLCVPTTKDLDEPTPPTSQKEEES